MSQRIPKFRSISVDTETKGHRSNGSQIWLLLVQPPEDTENPEKPTKSPREVLCHLSFELTAGSSFVSPVLLLREGLCWSGAQLRVGGLGHPRLPSARHELRPQQGPSSDGDDGGRTRQHPQQVPGRCGHCGVWEVSTGHLAQKISCSFFSSLPVYFPTMAPALFFPSSPFSISSFLFTLPLSSHPPLST